MSLCEMKIMEVPDLKSPPGVLEETHAEIVRLTMAGWKIIGHTCDDKKSAIWIKVVAELKPDATVTEEDETISVLSKQFGDARAKYVAARRKQGMSDVEIARDITVEYRDGGHHMRQLREAYNID